MWRSKVLRMIREERRSCWCEDLRRGSSHFIGARRSAGVLVGSTMARLFW
jgi:hypothetical protein